MSYARPSSASIRDANLYVDALASITVPKVEIHISDITKREEFRKVSVTAPVCDRQIYGLGLAGYLKAIDCVLDMGKKQG